MGHEGDNTGESLEKRHPVLMRCWRSKEIQGLWAMNLRDALSDGFKSTLP